jgi:multidrug efflux pump subunit AcrB
VVIVVAIQPGADAADMEQTVAKPIENVCQGLDAIDEVTSTSADGQAVVGCQFLWSSDPEKDYDEAVREINAIRPQLPSALQRLEFRKVRTTESVVVQYALVSDTASWRRMEKLAKDLRESFQRVPGVRGAAVWGLPTPEMRVSVDLGRLQALGIRVTTVTDALRAGRRGPAAGACGERGSSAEPARRRRLPQRGRSEAGADPQRERRGGAGGRRGGRALELRRAEPCDAHRRQARDLGDGDPEGRRERAGCARRPGGGGRGLRGELAARREAAAGASIKARASPPSSRSWGGTSRWRCRWC